MTWWLSAPGGEARALQSKILPSNTGRDRLTLSAAVVMVYVCVRDLLVRIWSGPRPTVSMAGQTEGGELAV